MTYWLQVAWGRLWAFFNKDRLDRELDQELATHLDFATEDNLRRGMSADEARRDAVLKLGSREAAKELHRETRGLPLVDALIQDLRFTYRSVLRDPAFYVSAGAILALAIGATTAIFSVVDGVLLRPAPIKEIDRLMMVWETDRTSGTTREPSAVPDFFDFRSRSRSFERLSAITADELNLSPSSGDPVRLAALRVTPEFLPSLGIVPLIGRGFTQAEEVMRGSGVVLISESLWERSFGRDPAIVGETLRIDDEPHTILGVLPDESGFGVLQILSAAAYSRAFADRGLRTEIDLWTPLPSGADRLPRDTHPIFVIGRLAKGSSVNSAQGEMAAIAADLERTYPSNRARGVFVEPLADVVFGPVRPALYVLLGTVALVLLIASVNVANLLLARGTARLREVAVRAALGGSRRRLAQQFLVESLVLAVVAGSAGVFLAYFGLQALLAVAPGDIPRLSSVAIDLRVLASALMISLAVGIVFGMVPMLQTRTLDLHTTLKNESGWQASGGLVATRLRSVLVVFELALAVVLVVGAGLLIKSFWHLQHIDPGFRTAGVLKAEYQLPPARYPADFAVWPNFKEMHAFTAALLGRATALPGVDAVAIAGSHPLDSGFTNSFAIVGRESEGKDWPEISIRQVTPGYFRTVGLSLRQGRLLQDADSTVSAPVLVINEAAAERFFPDRDPLGSQIRFWGTARAIVGVVANERFRGLAEPAPIAAYVPITQAPSGNGAGVLLLRTTVEPSQLTSAVASAIRGIDPGLAVFGVEPLDETMTRSVAERRLTTWLLGLFAALALLLAAVGIHGILTFTVARRTREIGLRMALGASAGLVIRLIVKEGLVLAIAGMAIGLLGALALTRLLASLLFGVTPTDPPTFIAVALFLAAVAVGTSYLPARRATQIDPAVALRTE